MVVLPALIHYPPYIIHDSIQAQACILIKGQDYQ